MPEAVDDVVPDGRVLLQVEPGRADEGEAHLAPGPVGGVPLGRDEVVGLLGPAAVQTKEHKKWKDLQG